MTKPLNEHSHKLRTQFDLDNINIEVKSHSREEQSNLSPYLFVHGNSQNTTCDENMRDYFYNRGHDVIAYDLPGHGNSPMQSETYHFDDLVELNFQLIKKLNLQNPILCGHSLGGMIQASTIVHKKIPARGLILCGSYDASPVQAALAQSQEKEAEQILTSLDQYIEEGFKLYKGPKKYNYTDNLSLEDELIAIFNRRYTHPMANKINLTTLNEYNVREELSKLEIPILVLHGEKEDIIPASLVRTMQLAYNNMKVEWYKNGGHFAFYQYPEQTRQLLDKHYQFIVGSPLL